MAQTIDYGDSQYFGLDTYHQPADVGPGNYPQADNLSPEAGLLVVRPGKQGQTAAALSNPLYGGVQILQTDGTAHIWYASGGNLYKHVPATNTRSQITYSGMPSLDTPNVTIAQGGGYVYVADGSANSAMRFDANGANGHATTGMSKPATITDVQLTNRPLLSYPPASGTGSIGHRYDAPGSTAFPAIPSTSGQSFIPSGSKNVPSGDTFWTDTGSRGSTGPNGDTAIYLDNPNQYVQFTNAVNVTDVGVPGIFEVSGDFYIKDDADRSEKLTISIACYSGTGGSGSLVTVSEDFEVIDPSNEGRLRFVMDCRNIGFVPASVKLKITGLE